MCNWIFGIKYTDLLSSLINEITYFCKLIQLILLIKSKNKYFSFYALQNRIRPFAQIKIVEASRQTFSTSAYCHKWKSR